MPDYDYKQLRIIEPKDPDQLLFRLVADDGFEICRSVGNPTDKERIELYLKGFKLLPEFIALSEARIKDKRTPEDVRRQHEKLLSQI